MSLLLEKLEPEDEKQLEKLLEKYGDGPPGASKRPRASLRKGDAGRFWLWGCICCLVRARQSWPLTGRGNPSREKSSAQNRSHKPRRTRKKRPGKKKSANKKKATPTDFPTDFNTKLLPYAADKEPEVRYYPFTNAGRNHTTEKYFSEFVLMKTPQIGPVTLKGTKFREVCKKARSAGSVAQICIGVVKDIKSALRHLENRLGCDMDGQDAN
eukprot:g12414.t1